MTTDTDSVFSTRISARGPDGNVYAVLGQATRLMREIIRKSGEGLVTQKDVEELGTKVLDAKSYEEAIGLVRRWFPVDMEE